MEGYVEILDSDQLELWEEYKDQETDKTTIFSIKDFQKYSHIRNILDEWAMQIIELLTTPPSHKVRDSNAVTLNPL